MKIFLWLFALVAQAQTWQLGTAADPCVGGYSLAFNGTTLRYGTSFVCTFPVKGGAGAYLLEFDFLEPIATGPKQRVMNVSVDDQPVLQNFDPWAVGATITSIATRGFVVVAASGNITVAVTGVTGTARLSAVRACRIRFITETP